MLADLYGKPRKKATEQVLNEALTMLETQVFEKKCFTVRGKTIGFHTHCDYCLSNRECVRKDAMYTLYPLLKTANGIFNASPVYKGEVSAQTKAVMNRHRAIVVADYHLFKDKVGMALAVGGDRIGGQELALQQIVTFYILNRGPPVNGGSFRANLGASFWSNDILNGVKKDEEGFRSLRKTVKRFTEFLEYYSQH